MLFVHPFLEEAPIPLWAPPQRTTEYPWQRRGRCLAIIYCLGCCFAFMLGIQDNLNTRPLPSQIRPLPHKWDQAIPQHVLGQYLLRSAVTPTHEFEPFVLLGRDTASQVTICAWTYDAGVRHIEAWLHAWAGAASIVVVTSSEPKDKIYQDLLTYIQHLRFKSLVRHLSIHVLRVQEGESSPNAWLNLASVFVQTDYTLLWPGDVSPPLPTHITAETVSKSLIRDRNAFILASRIAAYPFASFVPMVIPSGTTFWCTERLFIGRNRENDWDECLWQFSLEFGPAVRLWQALDLHNHVVPPKIAASDMLLRHRLRNRFRAESCEAAYKRLVALDDFSKGRMGRLEWTRKFCARTIDKKMNN